MCPALSTLAQLRGTVWPSIWRYAAPLLSTLVLMMTGFAKPSLLILAACLLITSGAVLAAKSLLFGRRPVQATGEARA
jgi:hypothetical protein